MLIENTPNPFRVRKTEHVPAVGGGPIGHAESGFGAGNQSSNEDQECGATGGKEDETMKCNVFVTHERFGNSGSGEILERLPKYPNSFKNLD
jgi:hypothetical protein